MTSASGLIYRPRSQRVREQVPVSLIAGGICRVFCSWVSWRGSVSRDDQETMETSAAASSDLKDVKNNNIVVGDPSPSTQRWSLLGRFISSRKPGVKAEKVSLNKISRRPGGRFNVIQCSPVHPLEDSPTGVSEQQMQNTREVIAQYTLSCDPNVVLTLRQRKDSGIDLNDFINSQKHDIDSTGLVCMWPAEEIMTYYCISRPELFRNKRVIELGSGYGLAGLAIAACTEASEVLLTDGNPQVVEYIRKNITENSGLFGDTNVRTCALHWSRHQAAMPGLNFDVVIAADCTFFKDFHVDLAHTIKGLLSTSDGCEAILFNPRRGDSLDRFVRASQSVDLDVEIQEQYDSRIWDLHQGFLSNESGTEWPNYDEDHCYPLLLSITHQQPQQRNGGGKFVEL